MAITKTHPIKSTLKTRHGNVETAAYADGKPIHVLWKRTGLSHRTANRFPTATPGQAVYTHSHNAYYCYYHPILPYPHVWREGDRIEFDISVLDIFIKL